MNSRFFFVIAFLVTVSFLYASDVETKNTEVDAETTLSVKTDISGAEVYLNGLLTGKTPFLSPVKPGLWRLSIVLDGYYPEQRIMRIEPGEDTKVELTLKQITGTLRLENIPNGGIITVSEKVFGKSGITTLIELPEGNHTVKVRAFGYANMITDISITRKKETILDVSLQPAPFSLSNFRATKQSFNPSNPGNLGLVQFRFTVTANGNATLHLRSPEGLEFPLASWQNFTGWDQESVWNGKTPNGNTADNGSWTAILTTEEGTQLEATILVDNRIHYPQLGFSTASSSTGPVTSATVMPPGSRAILFDLGIESNAVIPGLSVSAGWNLGTSWLFETTAQASMYSFESTSIPLNAGLSVKTGFAFERVAGAGYIRGLFTFGSDSTEAMDATLLEGAFIRNGLTAGAVGELRKGPVSADLDISFTRGDITGNPSRGPVTTAIGVSITGQTGLISGGLWVRGETGPLGENLKNLTKDYCFNSGLSARILIPGTNLIVIGEIGSFFGVTQKIAGAVSFGMLF